MTGVQTCALPICLKIAKEIGDQAGEGGAYGNLAVAYDFLGDYRKTIEYHERHWIIRTETGDRGEEGTDGNLGNVMSCNVSIIDLSPLELLRANEIT